MAVIATLLERERELQELDDALTQARDGRGQLVIIEGPAGRGKSTLLRAAQSRAAELSFIGLRARASELERGFAYGCVRQLLEPVIGKASREERERLFDGAAALSMPLFARSEAPEAARTGDSAFAMLHGLYWLLNNLASTEAVALHVDDLQWCDAESIRFLAYLAARLDGLRIAVLATLRPGETPSAELARLCAGFEAKWVRPQPLSVEATAALVARELGSAAREFVAACRDATAGNPFLLEALLREIKDQRIPASAAGVARVRRVGPATVARAVLLRLASAPPAASAVVRAGAVLGDGASIAEIAALAETSEEEASTAADLLAALAILQPAERVEFVHAIVKEAVYADIGANERARMHARAAQILLELDANEERVAAQIAASDPAGDQQRVALLRRVAARALEQGAPSAAAAWWRRALAEPPAEDVLPHVLLELGSAELRLALPEAAERLAEAVRGLREPAPIALAVRHHANALSMSGNAVGATAALETAIARVEREDRELALLLEAELAAKALQAGRALRAGAAHRLARHVDLKGATPGERLVLASLAFQQAYESESADEAARHIERGFDGGRWLAEHPTDVVGPFYALLIGALATDALDAAETYLERALNDARARASIPAIGFLVAHRSAFSLRRGAVGQAEADARAALELLSAHDVLLGRRFALSLLVEALVEIGELDGAQQALDESGLADDIPPGLASNCLLLARGLLRIARGETRAGFEDLLDFGRRDELWSAANPLASRWRAHASQALATLGDRAGARRMAADDVERARRWGAATEVGIALRAAALLEGGTAAIDGLRAALEVLARSPARLEHARVLVDLGAALRRANQRAEARGALEQGLELAKRCGASVLADRARTELRAAGGRSSDPVAAGAEKLTVSERRVAELAAQGHSNPKIAQALFVTRKTVETHLGHIYAKLNISGRAELARALTVGTAP